jgi:hypothetical protein
MSSDALGDVILDGDEQRVCIGCRTPFLFTAHERAWFSDKGYQDPKRCRPCRRIKRQRFWNIERAATAVNNAAMLFCRVCGGPLALAESELCCTQCEKLAARRMETPARAGIARVGITRVGNLQFTDRSE